MLKVVLAQPRGFCAGVERAIEIVERALKKFGPPIYVRHEIVHNRHVVEDLRTRGAVFVDELDEIPPGAMTVFSAHGVAKRVEEVARERGLPVIDATCPLVAKVHNEGRRYAGAGREIVLVGHAGHAEVEGTIGQIDGVVHLVQTVEDVAKLQPGTPDRLAYITQTTLSVDDAAAVIDLAVVHRQLSELKSQLARNSPKARKALPALRDALGTSPHSAHVETLSSHLDRFDFRGATQALSALLADLPPAD